MNAHLRRAPPGMRAHLTAAKLKTFASVHHRFNESQQAACLRRKFIERLPHQFLHEPVRRGDVFTRGFDIGKAVLGLHRALVLIEQRDGADQRQILHVVAPHARKRVGKRQFIDKRIHHEQRLQQPLSILMQADELLAPLPLQQACEGLLLALQAMNGLGPLRCRWPWW